MNRRGILLAALLLVPGLAEAQAPPRRRRRPRRASRPATTAPAAAPPRDDLAPVPNRDIDAPRRAETTPPAPQIAPTLIDPAEPRFGATGDPFGPQAREDRLLRQPGAGARLRVPFSY